jgi:fucose 4-O-acetylase-like acetyltransferase
MTRLSDLDNAKGIAIAAVVIFHVLRGFQTAGLIGSNAALQFADALAYGFHVQMFFIIAGFLAFPRAGELSFQRDRQLSLYYPYLLWSAVSWAISYALASKVNSGVTIDDLLHIPFRPIEHFWFLLILMIGTALLAFLRNSIALAGAILVLTIIAIADVAHWYDIWTRLILILIGAWMRSGPGLPPVSNLGGLAGACLLGTGCWLSLHASYPIASIWLLWSTLGGCYACYVLAHRIVAWPGLYACMSYLGQHSMPIYLLHVCGGAGSRIILREIAPGLPVSLSFALSLVGAFAIPLIIYEVSRRLGLSRWLGLDAIRYRRNPAPATQPLKVKS